MKSAPALAGRPLRLPVLLLIVLATVSGIAAAASETAWWEDAVFYEVFVRSFYDSDGDGIGDLNGLIERLDHLNDGDPSTTTDLGVTGLWLMPIAESPSYHGYDVEDYYSVDPDYGTIDDLRRLLDAAHARGMHVIVDLVLNHTSSEHPWFVASRGRASAFREWYLWSTTLPQMLGPWGQQVWHFGGTGYYYGLFWSEMPDLDYRNPDVSVQMFDVVRFWLDEVGVDGFRLDAVRHLIENGEDQENTPATHFWLKAFYAVAKGWRPDGLLLGEVWDTPSAIAPYLDRELDLCFEFSLADAVLSGVRNGRTATIVDALSEVLTTYPDGRYAPFLSNHDQARVMTQLQNDEAKAKLAAAILMTLPGTPFVYYGEEIGMTGDKPDERIRTPMQWHEDAVVGFTTGTPWEPLADDRKGRSVSAQTDDPDSLFSTYRRLIHFRNASAVLRTGDLIVTSSGHLSILSYLRTDGATTVWVLHNLSSFAARPSALNASNGADLPPGTYEAVDRLGALPVSRFRIGEDGRLEGNIPSLAPRQSVVLELRAI